MSHLGRFIAFEAAVNIVTARGQAGVLDEIDLACRAQADLPASKMRNHVKRLYDLVTHQDLCSEVARLITPRGVPWNGTVEVVYQTVDGLRQAMPGHTGDWYFTGDYPTPGGYRVLNRAYLNWRHGIDGRAY
jgi:amidophosphoribosyltransferase